MRKNVRMLRMKNALREPRPNVVWIEENAATESFPRLHKCPRLPPSVSVLLIAACFKWRASSGVLQEATAG